MKLRTLRSQLQALPQALKPLHRPGQGGSADKRASYSVRTKRRLKLWSRDPHCAACRMLTVYPWGFELDHIVPLHKGGADDEANSQVLCVYTDEQGRKAGCHIDKTRQESGCGPAIYTGLDGFPIDELKT